MANTTFSGPVRSLNGFISFGPKAVVSLTADTSLTVASHAGRVLLIVLNPFSELTGPEKVVFAML